MRLNQFYCTSSLWRGKLSFCVVSKLALLSPAGKVLWETEVDRYVGSVCSQHSKYKQISNLFFETVGTL